MRKKSSLFSSLALLIIFLTGCNFDGSRNSYTIKWNNYDGTTLEIDHVKKGVIPTYDGQSPTRLDDDKYTYTWSGWDPEVVPAVANQTYTATYSYERLTTVYTINFDLNGGTSASYSGSKTVEAFTKDVFFYDCVKEGWNFRGWSYNSTKIFDEKGNQLANPKMAKTMTFVAIYAQTAKMTIVSNLEGAGNITGEGEYPYNTYVDVSAYAKQGYKFIGWYFQDTLLSNANEYKYMMWSEDVTLEARFKAPSFLMNIHTNNQDYGLVLLRSTLNNNYQPQYQEYRDYTTQVTIAAYSITDVRFLGWYDTNNKLVETNAVYNFVMPNHDYTLEAKWNYFTVSYVLNGGTNSSSNPTSYTIDSTGLTLKEPTRTGYDFLGWQYKGNYVTEINPSWIDNIELTAHWTASLNNLSVTSEDTSKGTVAITSGSGYSYESITVVATPVGDWAFEGWYHESLKVGKCAKYTFIMPTNDFSLVARFFTKAEAKEEEMRRLAITPIISEDEKTVTYGLYPQTNVNDSTLISSLNSLTMPESNGWYLYDGDYYAKVSANPRNSDCEFDNGTTIENGTTYWFKCEPIVWNILSNTSGEYYIVSSVLLDAHCYYNSYSKRTIDGQTIYPNNYKYSDIRKWLNEDFYNSAFALGNEYIQTTTVDNTDDPNNKYACDNTEDKVFLPSYQDYRNSSYGFSTNFSKSESRRCKTTDWARARGASCYTAAFGSTIYSGYFTRSPSDEYDYYAWNVSRNGELLCNSGALVLYQDCCVRPAITLKIA